MSSQTRGMLTRWRTRPLAGSLAALLAAGSFLPAPAAAWGGDETADPTADDVGAGPNEEDEPATGDDGVEAEAPPLDGDAPDDAIVAPGAPPAPVPEPPAPTPTARSAPAPAPAAAPPATAPPAPPAAAPPAPAPPEPAPPPTPAPPVSSLGAQAPPITARAAAAAPVHATPQAPAAPSRPDRAPAASTPRTAPPAIRIPAAARRHVVRQGESLWAIAARLLPASASNAQIAREVARLAALNADRLPAPDLLMPGQVLRLR